MTHTSEVRTARIAFTVGPWLSCKLTFGFQGREGLEESTLQVHPTTTGSITLIVLQLLYLPCLADLLRP